jgi:lysophospholipase L1-like esterase
MFLRQRDMRSEPVCRVVALGESTTWGYSVSTKEKCWVNQVVSMLEEFQGEPIELVNQGIGSNVITSECPAYPASRGAAAMDRVEEDVIAHNPDLVFLSYGLNDSRGGTTTLEFRRAYQQLIDRIREKINPTIVMLNTYYMHEILYTECNNWEQSSYDVTEVFNLIIRQLAENNDCILADIYAAEIGVDWIIDNDHCHPNDLGHRIIANRVFEAIVRNCSFVARTMPQESLIGHFFNAYGNGPEKPGKER